LNYYIIIPDFRGIGGAQLYALRRYNYLTEKGIIVSFIVGKIDDLILNNQKRNIPVFVDPAISFFTFDVRKSIRNKTKEHFKRLFAGNENTIIESLDPVGATWGELFAKEQSCKHFIYSLVEPSVYKNIQDRPIYKYFKYKLKRKEFVGLSSKSLEKIFGHEFGRDENYYVNLPYDSKEIPQRTNPAICKELDPESFVIGTVARLEKSYIPHLIESVIEFSEKNPHANITLIVAGDSETGNYKVRFSQKYLSNKNKPMNLKIIFPGYLNPLGVDFFNCLNIFVGMGTAAITAISQGCATIVLDPINNLSSGVLGVDTNNFAYSESGKQFSILESIEDLFYNTAKRNEAKKGGIELFKKEYAYKVCMQKLDDIISSFQPDKKYWNFSEHNIETRIIRFLYNKKKSTLIGAANRLRKLIAGMSTQ